MKKNRLILVGAALAFALTGCGSKSEEYAVSLKDSNNYDADAYAEEYDLGYADGVEAEYSDDYMESEVENAVSEDLNVENTAKSIDKMLIYECQMAINTIEFDNSIASFKESIKNYGGFIENENFQQNSYSYTYFEEDGDLETDRTYYATVRIPSDKYEEFTSKLGELGRVKSKNAYVTNVTQEYNDLKTTLEIYEAKQKRYIKLLAETTDDQYAIEIERELTQIEINIAQIKSRMNEINTDVDYSTVSITINEVNKYVQTPEEFEEMPYIDQFVETVKETGSDFISFVGDFILVLISILPYLLFWILIIFGIVMAIKSIIKAIIKKNKKKKQLKMEQKNIKKPQEVKKTENLPLENNINNNNNNNNNINNNNNNNNGK